MDSNDYSNQYWTWRIERLIDLYIKQAGETASIKTITADKAFYITEENGKRVGYWTKEYFTVTVTLDRPITNVTKLRHKLDQTINADIRITGDYQTIYFHKRPMHEAPTPR